MRFSGTRIWAGRAWAIASMLALVPERPAVAESVKSETSIAVAITLEGADRETTARNLTLKLENHLGAAQGLKFMVSLTRAGRARIVLKFKPEISRDRALADVRGRLASALTELPRETGAPVVDLLEPAAQPIAYLAFVGDTASADRVTEIAERFAGAALAMAEGVASVKLVGARQPVIRIQIDRRRLAAYGVTADDVAAALRQNRVAAAADTGAGEDPAFIVSSDLERIDIERLGQIVLKTVADTPVRLRDIAEIRRDALDDGIVARFEGRMAVIAEVERRAEAGEAAATRAVYRQAGEIAIRLPRAVRLLAGYSCDICARRAEKE
jgi:multidrug efflux pump